VETQSLNAVQVIILVSRLLSERRFDELGDLARQDERVFDQIVETMREAKWPFSFFAAASLSKAGELAVAPLIEALQDSQFVVRQIAAMALGDIDDRSAVEPLVDLLADDQEVVRQAAAVSLGKIGVVEAISPLLQTIGDDSELVRKAVVNALGMIGDERALPALERVAETDAAAVVERARAAIRQIRSKRRKNDPE
jgi:HEAT repeat protein